LAVSFVLAAAETAPNITSKDGIEEPLAEGFSRLHLWRAMAADTTAGSADA
jgi:hypothetical protein